MKIKLNEDYYSGAVTGVTAKIWFFGQNCRMKPIAVPATGQWT